MLCWPSLLAQNRTGGVDPTKRSVAERGQASHIVLEEEECIWILVVRLCAVGAGWGVNRVVKNVAGSGKLGLTMDDF